MADTKATENVVPVDNIEEITVEPITEPAVEAPVAEYPKYTKENPMKLPVEGSEDFVLGLDFGDTTSIVSVAKSGEITHNPFVLHNKIGDLRHSALISFGEARILGADASSQLILNPKQTIYNIKYLNNKKKEETDSYPFQLTTEESNEYTHIEFEAEYLKNPKLCFSQIIGGLVSKFSSFAESDSLFWQFRDKILRQRIPKDVPVEKTKPSGVSINNMVIGIPACYSPAQRAAILDAGNIAGVQIKGIVDESVASVLTYAISRRHDLKEQADLVETVAVIDMGHSFFNICIAQISYNKVNILHSSAIPVGAGEFEKKIANYFEEKLKKKFSVTRDLSLRVKARLARAVTKTMKVLSTVTQSHLDVENFNDGIDVREAFSRADFETLCDDLLLRVHSHVVESISAAGISGADVIVEIVGGGCRIPSVQEKIKAATGVSQLHFNLDSNNSVSIGAAIYGSLVLHEGPLDLEDQSFTFTTSVPAHDEEMISSLRMSEADLVTAMDLEKDMKRRDQELEDRQELRNSMEQFLYQFYDHISTYSGGAEVPPAEISAIQATLDTEQEWLRYNEESASCSFMDLKSRFDTTKENLLQQSPQLHELLEKKQIQKEKEEKEAAEQEANRKETYRDKVKNPKTPKEKVDAAIARKDQGNTFFKDLNYEHATTRYLQAINLLVEIPGDKYTTQITAAKLSCHLNLAMCYINLKKFKLSIENCNMALRIDDDNVKAYFRRGKSKYLQKLYEEAKIDFELAIAKDPANTAAKKQRNLCDKQIKLQKEKEKKMYAKMFA